MEPKPYLPAHQRAVIKALYAHPGGLTDQDIQAATMLPDDSARRVRSDLVKMGLVVDSGIKREILSGRNAAVWRVITGRLF